MKHPFALAFGILAIAAASACGSDSRDPFVDDSAAQPGGNPNGNGAGFNPAQGCQKGGNVCVGNDVHACLDDGTTGAFVKSCDDAGEFCLGGQCSAGCDAAEGQPSNVGCEFWAVDLDNEYSDFNDAAGQPWGVVVSNFGKTPAIVTIEQNDAPLGAKPVLSSVHTESIAPGSLAEIVLPTREVDGSTSKDNGPGTMVSPNALRIRSSAPVVAYQFNTLKHSYSNDASLLVPKNGLGTVHRVIGWPTTNPIALAIPDAPPIAGVPDHSFVTVVGTQAGTKVTVKLGGPIVGGGGVPAKNKGEIVDVTLNEFDVLNLESTGIPGDMTGTIVESSAPVAVFTGGERGIAPIADGPPPPPNFTKDNFCCTDHLEEQVLPVTSYGKTFVITRSPIRSKGGYVEPDLLRFMGVAAATVVKTSLPPPFDTFTLQPGEVKDAWTTTDFIVEASEPLVVAQILVSQGFTDNAGGEGGDPSLTIYPPVDQYRRDYLFNVPTSWEHNYVVISAPVGAKITIDGITPTGCVVAPAGIVAAKAYEARRCTVTEGAHRMAGDAPFGIVAYGYGSRGSYAFVGGANVRKIYEPPPLK
jgi:hypothetical protein